MFSWGKCKRLLPSKYLITFWNFSVNHSSLAIMASSFFLDQSTLHTFLPPLAMNDNIQYCIYVEMFRFELLLLVGQVKVGNDFLQSSLFCKSVSCCLCIRMFHLSKLQPHGQELCSTVPPINTRSPIVELFKLMAGRQAKSLMKITVS